MKIKGLVLSTEMKNRREMLIRRRHNFKNFIIFRSLKIEINSLIKIETNRTRHFFVPCKTGHLCQRGFRKTESCTCSDTGF